MQERNWVASRKRNEVVKREEKKESKNDIEVEEIEKERK